MSVPVPALQDTPFEIVKLYKLLKEQATAIALLELKVLKLQNKKVTGGSKDYE